MPALDELLYVKVSFMSNDHQTHIVDEKDGFFELGADIKTTVSIQSNLPVALVVRQRNGVSSAIRPKYGAGYQSGNVVIQIEVSARPEVFLNIDQQSMETLPEEYQILYQAIQVMKSKGAVLGNFNRACIKLTYDHKFFVRHGGEFYSPLADVVFSLLPIEQACEHPFTINAIHKRQSQRVLQDYEGLALYAVRVVDRFDQLGPRYMNVAGDVFRVDPVPIDELVEQQADGLYILGTQPMRSAKDATNDARSTFIPLETLLKDPNKYGLWSSFGEARHQGNKQLETTQNALEVAQRAVDKKDRLIENLKRELEEAKTKQKQDGSLVMHKGLTELLKLATAMIGIVKLLK